LQAIEFVEGSDEWQSTGVVANLPWKERILNKLVWLSINTDETKIYDAVTG